MQSEFNITAIPQEENTIELKTENTLDIIKNNYRRIIEDLIKLIKDNSDKNSKPLTLFHLFFLVEIWSKYYLIHKSFMTLQQVEEKRHGIKELFESLYDINLDCKEIEKMLKSFKDKDGRDLNIDTYHAFKYNKMLYKDELIFDFECSDNEKRMMRDVIEWIEQYICIQ